MSQSVPEYKFKFSHTYYETSVKREPEAPTTFLKLFQAPHKTTSEGWRIVELFYFIIDDVL